jgi:cyanate lyase
MSNTTQTAPTTPSPTGPQRYLPPHLAEAIRTGKEATGLSWREFAKVVGRSHSHLNNLSLGKRVPSRETAEALIDTLNLKGDIAEEFRAAAVPMWWQRDVVQSVNQ